MKLYNAAGNCYTRGIKKNEKTNSYYPNMQMKHKHNDEYLL